MIEERARILSRLLIVVAVVLMAAAMWSSSWLIAEHPSEEFKVGLWGIEHCGGGCKRIDLDEYVRYYEDAGPIDALQESSWETLGTITLVLGALAVVALIATWKVQQPSMSAPTLFPSRLPAISAVAHFLAIGSALVLVAYSSPETDVVVGHAFTMFLVGAVSGLIATAALWPAPKQPPPATEAT